MSARFVVAFLLAAFGLHLAWEFAQCGPFYVGGKFPLTIGGMLHVTIADVGLSALIYGLVAVALRDAFWGRRPSRARLIAAAALGAGFAVAIELHALAAGRWSYSDLMPEVPALGAGVLPVLQLALITVFSVWIAQRLSVRPPVQSGPAAADDDGRSSASTAAVPKRTGVNSPESDG